MLLQKFNETGLAILPPSPLLLLLLCILFICVLNPVMSVMPTVGVYFRAEKQENWSIPNSRTHTIGYRFIGRQASRKTYSLTVICKV